MRRKKFCPLYLEYLKFLIVRGGWIVTKNICILLLTKKESIFYSLQKVKNLVEKEFSKLLNKAIFGYHYCNKFDNCTFKPTSDEIANISYMKMYFNLFEKSITNFVNPDLIKAEIGKYVTINY